MATTTPMFGPPNRDRVRWQRRALRVLSDLLGNDPGLPVLAWTIARQGNLLGQVVESDPSIARQQWETWVAHLEATTTDPGKLVRWPESGTETRRYLRAVADRYEDLVTVSVLADLQIDESGQDAPEEG